MDDIVERSAKIAAAWWVNRVRAEELRWHREASTTNGEASRPLVSESALGLLSNEIADCVRETHPDAWCIDLTVSAGDPVPSPTPGEKPIAVVILSPVLARAARVAMILPSHFPVGSSMIIGGDGSITVRRIPGDPFTTLCAAR